MRKIYVSDRGNDKNDGLTSTTPIRSWQRFIELCVGNDEIIIMGTDTVRMRLIAEIDKKSRYPKCPLQNYQKHSSALSLSGRQALVISGLKDRGGL